MTTCRRLSVAVLIVSTFGRFDPLNVFLNERETFLSHFLAPLFVRRDRVLILPQPFAEILHAIRRHTPRDTYVRQPCQQSGDVEGAILARPEPCAVFLLATIV